MSEKIISIENKLDDVGIKVDKILDSIVGDDMGNPGIIPIQKDHEKRLKDIERNMLVSNSVTKIETKIENDLKKKFKLTGRDYKVAGGWTAIISALYSLYEYFPDLVKLFKH